MFDSKKKRKKERGGGGFKIGLKAISDRVGLKKKKKIEIKYKR